MKVETIVHHKLDEEVKWQLNSSDTFLIIYENEEYSMKTVIIKTDATGDVWLFQSIIHINCTESRVDTIRLIPEAVEAITASH
jgi:protein gp37